jgi:hypothetical protein
MAILRAVRCARYSIVHDGGFAFDVDFPVGTPVVERFAGADPRTGTCVLVAINDFRIPADNNQFVNASLNVCHWMKLSETMKAVTCARRR